MQLFVYTLLCLKKKKRKNKKEKSSLEKCLDSGFIFSFIFLKFELKKIEKGKH